MEQSTHERVITFINLIKGHKNGKNNDAHEILEQVYTHGNCYMFAKALQFVFPQAIIYSSDFFGHHVIAKIDDKFYDITGEFKGTKGYEPITEDQERIARTWCYSHRAESCYGLRDHKGNRIEELSELKVNVEKNEWRVSTFPSDNYERAM